MPEYLGVIGAASGGPAILNDADLILLVGGRVDYRLGYLKPPAIKEEARVIRIDRDPGELNQGVVPDVGILGDPSMVLQQVRDEWLRRHLAIRIDWLREAQTRSPAVPQPLGQGSCSEPHDGSPSRRSNPWFADRRDDLPDRRWQHRPVGPCAPLGSIPRALAHLRG